MKKENKPIGKYRWRVCALLFFATTINYIDRQVIGILAPELQKLYNIGEADYGYIVTAFQIAYAIGLTGMGRLLDHIGTRWGYSIAISLWSIAGILHAAARGTLGFAFARFGLGIGEAANFPAAIKTVAEWFPKKERAFATGIFNSGSNIGAIIAPLTVPFIAIKLGWQWAFIITGLLGFVWLIFWRIYYNAPEKTKGLTEEEYKYIVQDKEVKQKKIAWSTIMKHRETWAICLSRFVTDPVWWFFLYWLPKYLNTEHGITLEGLGLPLITIYLISDLGSIGGGWLSSHFIKRGRTVDFARKTTILICGLMVLPILLASQTSHLWVAVGLISLATAAHQGWSANIFTIVSDIFPKNAVASVVGLSGTVGAIGGALVASAVGLILEATGSYILIFSIFSVMYLLAWAILKIGIPSIKPLKINEK